MSGILWLCCTISGAAALALEVLWRRSAGLVLGATARSGPRWMAHTIAARKAAAVSVDRRH